jgi:hypothetical protein
MTGKVDVIGHRFNFDLGPNAVYQLYFVDSKHLEVTVLADASYPKGTLNRFDIEMTDIRYNVYMVTWIESATGNTVTHVEDYERKIAYSNSTDISSRQFWRLKGEIKPVE